MIQKLYLLVLIGTAIFLTSCADSFENWFISRDTSMNVCQSCKSWPQKATLSELEQKALEEFGKPDFFRVWYNRRGDWVSSTEAVRQLRKIKPEEIDMSWIYYDDEIEVVFTPNNYKKLPLSDKLKILCDYGDPERITHKSTTSEGIVIENWDYYSVGVRFFFQDDTLVKKLEYTPMGTRFSTY